MATVYLSEYPVGTGIGTFGNVVAVHEPSQAEQTVAITAGSVQSAAFNPNTFFVRVHTDAICSIKFGANPTAAATTKRLSANQTEYFIVSPGHKLAVITNT